MDHHGAGQRAQSTYSGVELTWQHFLDNGFGTRMQFTATRTRSYDQYRQFVGAINAAPPTTFTIGLLYDKGPISADVNWDHQSSYTVYCSQCTEVPGWPAISDPFYWVTASLHYRFCNGFEVYVEGKNLSNAIARTLPERQPAACPGRRDSTSAPARAASASATAPMAARSCWVCPGGIEVS